MLVVDVSLPCSTTQNDPTTIKFNNKHLVYLTSSQINPTTIHVQQTARLSGNINERNASVLSWCFGFRGECIPSVIAREFSQLPWPALQLKQ
jgi:hypothetical protein